MPEVQAMAERLAAVAVGARFAGATPLQFSGLKTFAPSPESLVGRVVEGVGRRGKFALFELGGPRIAFHLSQGGRVEIEDPPKSTRPKPAVVRFFFENRPAILLKEFGTERKAGWWVLAEGDDGPMALLGPEPYSDEFRDLIMNGDDQRRIHTMLRDQRTVAGVGRGYSDDILHRAQISPYETLKGLGAERRARLVETVHQVLEEGLVEERKRVGGLPTKVGDHWIVHGRHGTPCPRCGADLRRVSYEAYEVTYCPTCQTGGKVLADRRLSRLVR
jgi:formamidopyrimidine-DNA glycosylase